MSFILLGILNSAAAAGGGIKNFVMEFTSTQASGLTKPRMRQDVDGNYVFTYSYYDAQASTTGNYFFVLYFDSKLNLIWSKKYTDNVNKGANASAAVFDSNGHIVVSCVLNNQGPTAMRLNKANGSVMLRKTWIMFNQGAAIGQTSMAVNAAGNKFLFPGGFNNNSNKRRSTLAQLDSDLNITAVSSENVSSTSNYYADACAFDSSDNAYFAGLSIQNGYRGCLVFKVNANGDFAWGQKLGSDDDIAIRGMHIIGSDIYTINQSYIIEKMNTSNGSKTQVARLNYDIPWQPMIWGNSDSLFAIALQSNTAEYLALNTSFGILWSRKLSITNVTMEYGDDMAGVATPDGDIMMSGRFSAGTTQGAYFIKVPADGSLAGTAVSLGPRNYTYTSGTAGANYSYPLMNMTKTPNSDLNNTTEVYNLITADHIPTYAFGEM